mgnify:CR=1 FL=1
MKLKKILCLLLALLMVCSMAACGEDADEGGNKNEGGNKDPQKDPTVPTTTVPPEDDTVWVLVRESNMGSSRYSSYVYDEEGNLVSGEYFNGLEKMGDYKFVTTKNADGGKLVEQWYKHVKDAEFWMQNTYEFNAAGKLTCTTDYDLWGNVSTVYTFTYNDAGQLVEQTQTTDGEVVKKLTFVYEGDLLMEGHYWDKNENYGHYIYTYDENGVPVKANVDTYYMDDQKYTLEFVADSGYNWWRLDTTEEGDNVVGGRRLFFFEDEEEYRGVQIKNWGVFHTGWLPLVSFGCIDTGNYFFAVADLRYEPLDVHLAKQGEG